MVQWTDPFGEEHIFTEGRGDDVFHVMPYRLDENGDSYIQILSKKAIIEMADFLKKSNLLAEGHQSTE